ncbi:MAG: hypothetical protein M1834_003364 [Cirrosporium novae-zelandiae]|nr:MAG: hypothetical protein M1834_003364 [Cirrosporium novae-zelandiae]
MNDNDPANLADKLKEKDASIAHLRVQLEKKNKVIADYETNLQSLYATMREKKKSYNEEFTGLRKKLEKKEQQCKKAEADLANWMNEHKDLVESKDVDNRTTILHENREMQRTIEDLQEKLEKTPVATSESDKTTRGFDKARIRTMKDTQDKVSEVQTENIQLKKDIGSRNTNSIYVESLCYGTELMVGRDILDGSVANDPVSATRPRSNSFLSDELEEIGDGDENGERFEAKTPKTIVMPSRELPLFTEENENAIEESERSTEEVDPLDSKSQLSSKRSQKRKRKRNSMVASTGHPYKMNYEGQATQTEAKAQTSKMVTDLEIVNITPEELFKQQTKAASTQTEYTASEESTQTGVVMESASIQPVLGMVAGLGVIDIAPEEPHKLQFKEAGIQTETIQGQADTQPILTTMTGLGVVDVAPEGPGEWQPWIAKIPRKYTTSSEGTQTDAGIAPSNARKKLISFLLEHPWFKAEDEEPDLSKNDPLWQRILSGLLPFIFFFLILAFFYYQAETAKERRMWLEVSLDILKDLG